MMQVWVAPAIGAKVPSQKLVSPADSKIRRVGLNRLGGTEKGFNPGGVAGISQVKPVDIVIA
jgi:hypothetical protein